METEPKVVKEGHAYTPGLKIKGAATILKLRRLPMLGKVFVNVGDDVDFRTKVAEMIVPGNPRVIMAALKLAIQKEDLRDYMKKNEGDKVEEGEPIAGYNAFFGLMKNWVYSPINGYVETISDISGQIILREDPISVTVDSYVSGKVVEVFEGEGATIETNGAFIQGILGVGGETHGKIEVVVNGPNTHLTEDLITPDCHGKILIGGSLVTKEALIKANEVGVAGIVTGGIRDTDLKEMLGYEIGVAITGHEEIGTTLILTEGFGEMAMSQRTFSIFKEFEGEVAAMNGATQIRAGVMRPEVIIPHERSFPEEDEDGLSGGMRLGTPIRVIRQPYFGRLGKVLNLLIELQRVETGSTVRVVEVELDNGERVVVPRANVEILEI